MCAQRKSGLWDGRVPTGRSVIGSPRGFDREGQDLFVLPVAPAADGLDEGRSMLGSTQVAMLLLVLLILVEASRKCGEGRPGGP